MAEQGAGRPRFEFFSLYGLALYLIVSTLGVWVYVEFIEGLPPAPESTPVLMGTPREPPDQSVACEIVIPPEALIDFNCYPQPDPRSFWSYWMTVQCAVTAVAGLLVMVREALGPASRHAG